MVKYSKQAVSENTRIEAQQLANHIKKPGQTKEQTRLITQGIQKGIELYKKQQKAKARELDKKLKKASQAPEPELQLTKTEDIRAAHKPLAPWLPWIFLVISWLGFVCYLVYSPS